MFKALSWTVISLDHTKATVGLGPKGTKAGNLIFNLCGCSVPVILRAQKGLLIWKSSIMTSSGSVTSME